MIAISTVMGNLTGAIAIAQQSPPINRSQELWETLLDTAPHKLLIVGRWRGFHAAEDQQLYYLYEFKADGSYTARHRLYETEDQYQDEFWQGTWDFDGNLVEIKGNELKNPENKIQLQFKFANDNFLYAQIEGDPQRILPMKMGKMGSSNQ